MNGQVRNRGKRKDGSVKWEGRLWLTNGQRIAKTFRTRKEAQDWLTHENHARLTNPQHNGHRNRNVTFLALSEAWRSTWVGIEPRTAQGYEQILKSHLLPEFGHLPVSQISPRTIQSYISSSSQRQSPGTVRNIYAALRNAFNTAERLRLISPAQNPCQSRAVRLPRSPREEMLFLTPQEISALATEIQLPVAMHGGKPVRKPDGSPARQKPHPSHELFSVLITTAAYTGLRAGELLALRRSDVDLLHGRLLVRRALKTYKDPAVDPAEGPGREIFAFGPTKTHQIRTVSLPKFLVELLSGYLSTNACLASNPDALIFPSATQPDVPMRHNLFYRRHFKPAVRRALPASKHTLRFHDLRHTCASLLIAQGVHAKAIQERLGHSSIGITMDRYGHLLDSAYTAVADALDAAYNAPQPQPPDNVVSLSPASASVTE